MSAIKGTVAGLQRSGGGVPKLPVTEAVVTVAGMEGDWQEDRRYHGGPDRALCLYSKEVIDALAAEGHPISPGAIGENITLAGVNWREVTPGVRLRIGSVEVEVVSYAAPCRTIAGAFLSGQFKRASQKLHPGWSRVYARVTKEGAMAVGDSAELINNY